MHKVIQGDCLEIMPTLPDGSIDLVVTSPPYDNLRTYNDSLEWGDHIWMPVIGEFLRLVKDGGVVVWIVGDATIDGSETGTSFRQALWAMEVGFNLHDTMIYRKSNFVPLTHNRYEQEWEYMFVLSKGKPKKFNPIMIKTKYGGQKTWGSPKYYKTADGKLTQKQKQTVRPKKIKGNIFEYRTGSTQTGKIMHPAMFPTQLAQDHIISWSNPGDTVLDPFAGSGTTGVACLRTGRDFILIEKEPEYIEIIKNRITEETKQGKLPILEGRL